MSVVSSKCAFSESYIIPCQVLGVSDASKCPKQKQFHNKEHIALQESDS